MTIDNSNAAVAVPVEQWRNSKAKAILQEALSSREIPVSSKDMSAKDVFDKYSKCPEFGGVVYDSTFTRRLRDLRNQQKRKNEDEDVKVDWTKSSAKKFLKDAFKDGTISIDCTTNGGPEQVWELHCKNNPFFVGMHCNDAFKRRLKSVCDDFKRKEKRSKDDLLAYQVYIKNHPRPTHNYRGEPQWDGSDAQKFLKDDMKQGEHLKYDRPSQFRETRPEYLLFGKKAFRSHIHQEKRLKKLHNYLEHIKQGKEKERKQLLEKQTSQATTLQQKKARKEQNTFRT